MTKSELNAKLEEILDHKAGSISGTESLDALGWDSLSSIGFLSAMDAKFGVTISASALAECRTVADLAKLVGAT